MTKKETMDPPGASPAKHDATPCKRQHESNPEEQPLMKKQPSMKKQVSKKKSDDSTISTKTPTKEPAIDGANIFEELQGKTIEYGRELLYPHLEESPSTFDKCIRKYARQWYKRDKLCGLTQDTSESFNDNVTAVEATTTDDKSGKGNSSNCPLKSEKCGGEEAQIYDNECGIKKEDCIDELTPVYGNDGRDDERKGCECGDEEEEATILATSFDWIQRIVNISFNPNY